jgi:predicted nucleotidyltransferase
MFEEIRSRLDSIERAEDVAILLAIESGSRAWGFASTDSDYDVRFIYVHRPDSYLSIKGPRRDVIERPIVDEIDVNGWDIRKALGLLLKSNPPLLEWLQCPVVYKEDAQFAQRLRGLMSGYYSPKASFMHYLHMARGNYREYLRGDRVWRKKYFYVLRPLLAMRWIERGLGPVPIEFERILDATNEDRDLRGAIHALLAEKRAGAELDYGPADPVIGSFVESELAARESQPSTLADPTPSIDSLDQLFRDTLVTAWRR